MTDFAGEDIPNSMEQVTLLTDDLDTQRPAEKAYKGIRHAILSGKLKPGDHLPEEMLASMTGTSRTPVREALRRLVSEGLATVNNRHRFVTDFSPEEVSIIFDIRAQHESYAASIAAQKITAAELGRLQHLIDAMAELETDPGGSGVVERFLALNTEFHSVIVDAARSAQLKRLTAPAAALPLILVKQFVMDQRVDVVRSNWQHRDILAALTARNSEWAAATLSGHILSTKPRLRDASRAPK
ncbi:GntR family transcriptional regulator [Hoeflea alexandrii]|jgi:DNA-binding GntR family transcriptional regulator|uniref:GntR family transcriptional regulator n=1 Tax=Hoeflea alexandrii TaxID=288436 RepID=A0ABT1CZN2_9HYPH|nr:GntR family transcriptional regulator [Hoeflea alexandrii]MCO6411005.1 GntR family transcriptional regulator [Hoeflea alexandrii]MCY0151136.1 GntR family transcriptional regulator [Hoeflea alexandrii]